LDDLATVVFSSGSTGDPKGVMLSHYNLASNVEQLTQTYDFAPRDRFLGILPFFHSFGFTATLLVPAAYGVGVAYHPNPLDARPIGELVRRYRLTYLMATPSLLQIYLRNCEPEDFGSLRFVMAGAEKLRERLVADFEEKFGIRPVEGFGCTECAPVVSANRLDFRARGFRQRGSRTGRIGHPMPGIAVRIVQPETRVPLAAGEPGLLLVRGPNVMQGYLNRPDKTAEVLREGWYETGDMATLDEDGFLQITGRLSRFSKIGGEMAPHEHIEEKLEELAGVHQPTFAVTGVPDEKKGERLVVLHTLAEPAFAEFLRRLPQLDLPNLWIPKANQFFAVGELPLLGNGKLDLRRLRERAMQLSREQDLQPKETPGTGAADHSDALQS
jgi:acyl-[acyl-carrier-protein]-phospholipid O-acyltransferase/long-chain-fatty-acid--[acyl-carrier-protein] ligase